MTGHQKEHITAMRMQGIDYSTIAKSLGLKKETVAAFCRKNGLSGVKATDSRVIPSQTDTCLVCGTVLVQIPGKKETSFLFGQVPHSLVEFSPGYGEPQGILLFRLQALRKVLYGIRKQQPEILFPSLLRRPKEPCPCLNPIVSVWSITSPPCCASKECILFVFSPHKPAPKWYNIPPEAHHNFVQYIPSQRLAICRRVW